MRRTCWKSLALMVGCALWPVALASEAAPATALISTVSIGDAPKSVRTRLAALGAEVKVMPFDEPGALAAGLLERPDLLAQLHQVGVQPPAFDNLPKAGPRVVVARWEGAQASYLFIDKKLWAAALALPQRSVAPRPDPFDAQRMRPLWESLRAMCPVARPSASDPRGNTVAWQGRCAGGQGRMTVDATDRDGAVTVVVWASGG